MNYYLILSDELLLVSDEAAGINDWVTDGKRVAQINVLTIDDPNRHLHSKVIAGTPSLPKITFSEEAYQQMKERFGWVDVESEVKKILNVPDQYLDSEENSKIDFGIMCFNRCQSLNKNMFSEEDMKQAISLAREGESNWQGFVNPILTSDEIIQHLRQPKRVKVEVDILTNTIKITRLC